jgi:hypothetical protein
MQKKLFFFKAFLYTPPMSETVQKKLGHSVGEITQEEFSMMWFELREGKISEEEWRAFCDITLRQEIERNGEVMIRLKNL